MAEIKTGWLTNIDGDKLYAWSHMQRVRYNESFTLDDVWDQMERNISNLSTSVGNLSTKISKLETDNSNLGESIREFIRVNYGMSTLYDSDGTTPIGFELE